MSTATLDESDDQLPCADRDLLAHDEYALKTLRRLGSLPNGSAVLLRAPWGRGKTDVLSRISSAAKQEHPSGFASVLVLNPWQYGDSDLIVPLVRRLLLLVPEDRRARERGVLRRAAWTVVAGGIRVGGKGLAGYLRGRPELPAGLPDAFEIGSDALAGIFDEPPKPDEGQQGADPDPVRHMAFRFRQLVSASLENAGAGQRLLICIDDLDRCLPGRQVATLEAMHFLLAPGVRCVFLAAIDPTLLRTAVAAHYGKSDFDADAYLDKIFEYSQDLPWLDHNSVGALVKHHLARPMHGQAASTLGSALADRWKVAAAFWNVFSQVLKGDELANPRVVYRLFRRLEMLALTPEAGQPLELANHDRQCRFAFWLGATQRWPQVRPLLAQDAGVELERLAQAVARKGSPPAGETENAVSPLPEPLPRLFSLWDPIMTYLYEHNRTVAYESPGFGHASRWREVFRDFEAFDLYFRAHGL